MFEVCDNYTFKEIPECNVWKDIFTKSLNKREITNHIKRLFRKRSINRVTPLTLKIPYIM